MFVKIHLALMNATRELKDRGAVAGEYAVLLALIAVAIVVAIGPFVTAISNAFGSATNVINN